jgi:hypothetical protein
MSSVLFAHMPLLTVHRIVADVPGAIPVMVVLASVELVTVAVPPITLHAPVPATGTVAFMVKVLALHCSISAAPASAVLGSALFVKITSSLLSGQVPFVMVHRNVALVPTGTPVTPLLSDPGVVTVAVPLTTVHAPLPATAAFAARVKAGLLHWGISPPALAVVGVI